MFVTTTHGFSFLSFFRRWDIFISRHDAESWCCISYMDDFSNHDSVALAPISISHSVENTFLSRYVFNHRTNFHRWCKFKHWQHRQWDSSGSCAESSEDVKRLACGISVHRMLVETHKNIFGCFKTTIGEMTLCFLKPMLSITFLVPRWFD